MAEKEDPNRWVRDPSSWSNSVKTKRIKIEFKCSCMCVMVLFSSPVVVRNRHHRRQFAVTVADVRGFSYLLCA